MQRADLFDIINRVIDVFVDNFYVKPREVIKLCSHPSRIFGVNYFPDMQEKSKVSIFCDQLLNILQYGAVDEFYYLYGLNVKDFRDKKDYINYRPFSRQRDKLNLKSKFNTSCILRNKLYFGIFAKSIGVATAENIACINSEDVLMLDVARHTSIEEFVKDYNGVFFCKPIDGECGKGVFKLTIDNAQININGQPADIDILIKMVSGTQFLLQGNIKQHILQAKLHPSSINSIRMVTVRSLKDGHIEVLPSILRIGANGSYVDNTSQGGIAIGFDSKTGQLNEYGYFKPEFGLRTNIHPNSGIEFSKYKIPHIEEAVKQAKYFHSFIGLHSIGWDIAIGEDGPIFIEGNDNWEINGPQSCNRGLANEYYNLFFK